MCIAVPGRIVNIEADEAHIDYGGVSKKASIRLKPDAKIGDCVLVHAGFVIEVLDETLADDVEQAFREIQE
ncbi:MAG TPA: HypC/HybG/HupF family hydrogenase formation chaperone [Clostridiales bacterium]|jgi:hydrogenase expression/formation protein HypC|nr:HypC/HybG/HupF family hydrogenase formation chaperone [Clostridiales bacterium]